MAYLGKTPSQAVRSRYYFTASGGETSLSGTDDNSNTLTFTDGNYVDVSLNGVALVAGSDYNTTTANTIGGLTALTASDVVEVVVYDTFSVFSGNVNSDFSVGGDLTITGTTTTSGNINFGDNDKAIFGAGNDLEIYSTGTDVNIRNGNDSSEIRIQSDDRIVFTDRGFNEIFAVFNDDSDVKLYHNQFERLATTSSGIDVTGNAKLSGTGSILQFDKNGSGTDNVIYYDNSTASNNLYLGKDSSNIIYRTGGSEKVRITSGGSVGIGTASPAHNVEIVATNAGSVNDSLQIRNNATSTGTGSRIRFINSTDANSDANGASIASVRTGNDNDLVFETENSEKMRILHNGRIGIGTSSPGQELHVSGTGSQAIGVGSTNAGGAYLFLDGDSNGDFVGADYCFVGQDDAGVLNIHQDSPSGTNEIRFSTAGTEAVRIDSSGNVGIGETSPANLLHVKASDTGIAPHASAQIVLEREGTNYLQFLTAETGTSGILFGDGSDADVAQIKYDHSTTSMQFVTEASEAMRIDSGGKLYVGTTSGISNERFILAAGASEGIRVTHTGGGTKYPVNFTLDGSGVGSISISSGGTSYNTSSDYRLKENVADMTGAIDRVKALAPKRFNFIADADTTVDGFLAHEAQAVVPEAVTGTHNEVDEDGNAVMQGIDQSKLVPLLTGALREAIAKIETLETSNADLIARIETLENAE
jgi:hypothetical protein